MEEMPTLPKIVPTKLTLRKEPFDSDDWIFELKHDGFRCIAYVADGECMLVSRQSNVFRIFRSLQNAIARALNARQLSVLWRNSYCRLGRHVWLLQSALSSGSLSIPYLKAQPRAVFS
jgi:hypothetical protein